MSSGLEAGDTVKHPTRHGVFPTMKKYLAPNASGARVEQSHCVYTVYILSVYQFYIAG